jgi:phosphate acetyltransferase
LSVLDSIIKKAKKKLRRIAFSEGEDVRVIEASVRAQNDKLAQPILIGDIDNIKSKIEGFGANPTEFEIIDPKGSSRLKIYAQEFTNLRKKRIISLEDALIEVQEPLNFAAMMVRTSDSDGTIGGAVETTSRTVGAALKIIGKAEDSSIVSSFFLIILDKPYHPKKVTLVFSDCGLVIEPTALQLSQIGQSSIQSYIDLIGGEPKVAMLSFSTYGSARHKSVRMVSEATALLKKAKPHVKIDGELQFDSAFVPSVSEKKAKGSELEGDANIMIFPNLDAANIGYKIAERIGGARAIGPILQGLSKPANDLSRGCSVDDIYDLMAVTAAQVK